MISNEKHLESNLEVYYNITVLFLKLDMFALYHLLPIVMLSKIIAYIDNIEEKH
jgi:hypothetical protein